MLFYDYTLYKFVLFFNTVLFLLGAINRIPFQLHMRSDGSNNCTRDATACFYNRNRNAVVSTTTATVVIYFNNRGYFMKFLFKKKFILPTLKFVL